MSFWDRLFRKEERGRPDIVDLFDRLAAFLNDDDAQNAATTPMILERMREGGETDIVPGASGEFGRCPTSPIPVNGPIGELTYLSRLTTLRGEKVFFHRLGSVGTIDAFELVSQSGSSWGILYLDMYHARKTRLVPKGYRMQPKMALIRGITTWSKGFPGPSFYDALCDRTMERFGAPIADPAAKELSGLRRPAGHARAVERCLSELDGRPIDTVTPAPEGPYLIDRPDPDEQFIKDWRMAGGHIDEMMSRHEERLPKGDVFRWIKAKPSWPSFDDMSFTFRDKVFCVQVRRRPAAYGLALWRDGRADALIRECRANDLVPCVFPIDMQTERPLEEDGWNLVDAVTGRPVDPIAMSSGALVEVSPWELMNWAVQVVSDHIGKKGLKLLSFSDAPGVDPQIWFEDADGERCWAKVIPAVYPATGEEETPSFDRWPKEVLSYGGFVARVAFMNAGDEGSKEKIYRSRPAYVRFLGIEPCHVLGRRAR